VFKSRYHDIIPDIVISDHEIMISLPSHPSSLRVYKEKYLQLTYAVSIPKESSICLNRSREESWGNNDVSIRRRKQKIPKGTAWVDFVTVVVKSYRKIAKISPSKYKPPKLVTQKTLRYIAPPNISPLGGFYLEIALKYKVKQSKNSV